MNRIRTQDTAERIGIALDMVPERLLWWMNCDIFEGDAYFAGLDHEYAHEKHGPWSEIMHYKPRGNYLDSVPVCHRVPTVCLPQRRLQDRQGYVSPTTILHELGHVLYHELTGDARGRDRSRTRLLWRKDKPGTLHERWGTGMFPTLAWPLTTYHPNFGEEFAEAFVMWLHPRAHYSRPPHSLVATGFYENHGFKKSRWYWTWRGERPDNRAMLAFFNELAGLAFDTPPVSMR